QVTMSFVGPPSRMRELRTMLQHGELRVGYTLTVAEDRQNEARYSDTVHIELGAVPAPPGVTPSIIEDRNRIPVTLHRIVERRLPVRLESTSDDRVGQGVVEPANVLVRGPQEVLDRARSISTLPFSVPARSETVGVAEMVTVGPLALVHELEG